MNFFTAILGRLKQMFSHGTDVGKAFGVQLIESSVMEGKVRLWNSISSDVPPWLDADDGITTINMAKHISDTRAKLVTLDLGIAVSGSGTSASDMAEDVKPLSGRAEWMQKIADNLIERLPDNVADAERLGGFVVKYNGESWDFLLPGDFWITAVDGDKKIVGAIFPEYITKGQERFTRLEYHRFEDGQYVVTNKAYRDRTIGTESHTLGSLVPLNSVEEWADMREETRMAGVEKPLFGYFRIPGSNTFDPSSPLGCAVFANALVELEAIDVGVSRKNDEVSDSKHITFVGQTVIQQAQNRNIKLPRFVQGLGVGLSDGDVSAIHEHTPSLLTDQRIKDINFNLSLAAVKCGFSEGFFVLDGQRGVITATQVESDDRDTIQTIKNDRDALKAAIEQALYGADVLASLMNLSPRGDYEVTFSFGDITYSYEEDKANWKYYVAQGWVPAWKYLVKFEKMTEEEARALTSEANNGRERGLFDQEE